MSGSSIGSIIGGVIGAVLAPFTGGMSMMAAISIGMALGGMVGGMLDPPKGPQTFGPRLHDLNQQTSTYGTFLPRIYGTIAVMGNVFWLENNALREEAVTQTQGGKGMGGASASQTTYKYYATFAVSLCEGLDPSVFGAGAEVKLLRIWLAGKLWYNADSDDFNTILESDDRKTRFAFYSGTDTQNPDPRMQADLGVANCPAYRGVCYIVAYDLDVENYGNSIAGVQVKVELATQKQVTPLTLEKTWTTSADFYTMKGNYVDPDGNFYIYEKQENLHTPGPTRLVYFNIETGKKVYSKYSVTLPASQMLLDGWVDQPCFAYSNGTSVFVYNEKCQLSKTITMPAALNGTGFNEQLKFYRRNGTYLFVDTENSTTTSIYNQEGDIVHTSTSASTDGRVHDIAMGQSKIYAITLSERLVAYNYNFTKLWSVDVSAGVPHALDNAVGGTNYIIREESDGVVIGSHNDEFWRLSENGVEALGTVNIKSGYEYHGGDGYWRGWWVRYAAQHGEISRTRINKTTYQPIVLKDIVKAECLRTNLLKTADFNVTELTQVVRGYRVSSLGSVRSGIEPLQGLWPFDVIQDGYKIKYVARGKTIDATISEDDLDARAGGSAASIRITTSREMETQLPRKVSITYMDAAREYDNGSQYYERTNTESVNTSEIEIPVVMTADEAYGKAQTLQYLYWLERYDVSFILPPEYLRLQPSDVIQFKNDGGRYQFRIKQINYMPDGRLEIQAKYNYPAIYAPTQNGQAGKPPSATLSRAGNTVYELLDVPLLQDAFNTSGLPVAMSGTVSGWPGGVLYKSDDGGQTFAAQQGFTKPGAVIGAATNVIGAQNAALLDKASRLNVQLVSGSLSSVTELQMLNGSNAFAYGAHGRWEIIGAQNAALQADGSYTLTDLVRGRFGTEQYMDNHAVDDIVVLLDSSRLKFIILSSSLINQQRHYKGVTVGKTLSTAEAKAFTYTGVNLECLNPVYLNGSRHPTTRDWTLTWVRRTRMGGEWRDKVDATLGEATESYDVEIYETNAFATLKATYSTTTPLLTYTSAQQQNDFGGTTGDPFYNNVRLLLWGKGANNGTTITDSESTPKTMTANGTAITSTAVSDPFGGTNGVIRTIGAGNIVSTPAHADFNPGTGDFTVEAMVYVVAWAAPLNSNNVSVFAVGRRDSGATGGGWHFLITNNSLYLESVRTNGTFVASVANPTISAGQWHYVAVRRDSSGITFNLNGTDFPGNNALAGENFTNPNSRTVVIGQTGTVATPNQYPGNHYTSNLRYTRGVGRTLVMPPDYYLNTPSFTTGDNLYSNRVLNLHMRGANNSTVFADTSSTPKTVTAVGNAKIVTTQNDQFGNSTGVGAFDGAGDFLQSADNAAFEIGAGDFSIETFVRFAGFPTNDGAGIYNFGILAKDIIGQRGFVMVIGGTATSLTSVYIQATADGTTFPSAAAAFNFALNTWYHLEVTRVSGRIYFFVNGNLLNAGGTAYAVNFRNNTAPLKIGAYDFGATSRYYLNGFMSDFRFTVGAGSHTSSFPMPTSPYADVQGADLSTLHVKVYQNSAIAGRGYPLIDSISRN